MSLTAPDAEKAVIAAVLSTSGGALMEVDFLRAEHFADPVNREVFSMAQGIWAGGGRPDKVVIGEAIRGAGVFPPAVLDDFSDSPNINGELHDYARIVEGKYRSREIVRITTEAADDAAEGNPEEVLDGLERQILELRPDTGAGLSRVNGEDVLASIGGTRLEGIPTGLKELDAYLGGLGAGRLITLASRPGVGKTTLALNIAASASAFEFKVAFFSLEMARGELLERLLARESHIPATRIRTGKHLTEADLELLMDASKTIGAWKLFIDDTAGLGLGEISSRTKKMKHDTGLDLVVVDYLQLMTPPNADSREQEVAAITRRLKLLARELKVPVLALSQVSRAAEARGGKPLLSDLRESGAIENDSDQVMTLWKKDDTDPIEGRPQYIETQVLKNRHGPVGEFRLEFEASQSRFRSA